MNSHVSEPVSGGRRKRLRTQENYLKSSNVLGLDPGALPSPVMTPPSTPTGKSLRSSVGDRESFIACLTDTDVLSTTSQPGPQRPASLGIHHLKFAVSSLDVSLAWYERVLGAQHMKHLDHVGDDGNRFAAICQMVDWAGMYLELRQTQNQSDGDRGWDPITLAVQSKTSLVEWIVWLDRWGTNHSPLLTGVRGWLLIFEDPDGRRIRMYTRESHHGSEPVSSNSKWLSDTRTSIIRRTRNGHG